MSSDNPKVQALFTQLRMLLIAVGAVLAYAGFGASPAYKYAMIASGAVAIVCPAAWDFFSTVAALFKSQAVGVQAGINLVTSGEAIDKEGNIISKFNAGATPPKAVTLVTAPEIVKNYGPSAVAKE